MAILIYDVTTIMASCKSYGLLVFTNDRFSKKSPLPLVTVKICRYSTECQKARLIRVMNLFIVSNKTNALLLKVVGKENVIKDNK